MSTWTFGYAHKWLGTCALVIGGGLLAGACTTSSPAPVDGETFEVIEDSRYTFGGFGKPDVLPSEESAIYESDRAYLHTLIPPDTPAALNHADERQHRFVMMRLKMAGKSPQNSPELFSMLNDVRNNHLGKGLKSGTVYQLLSDTGRKNAHYLGSVNVLNNNTMEVLGTGAIKDTIYYGYVDGAPWDKNGKQLGNMAYVEVYGNMPFKTAKTTGNLGLTALKDYEGDSLLIQDNAVLGYQETYTYRANSGRPKFGDPLVNAPISTVGDACIHVCLERNWGDCDYSMLGWNQLKLPLKGSITISSDHTYDNNKITQYKNGTAIDDTGAPDTGGSIRVVLKDQGGDCNVDAGGSIALGMKAFWQTVTLTNGNKTLNWDMTGANVAVFDSTCTMYQDNVELNMTVTLPTVDPTNITSISSMSISNNPNADPKTKKIACMRMTNSCLAAGTMIEMADGRSVAIESIKSGDAVYNPFDRVDSALVVADTAKGTERTPMVRIEEEHGRTLLMTETHPIDVVGRGMVMAKYLQVGDQVTTKDGPSKLIRVTREKYDGTVHNVKVGNETEVQGLGVDQTTVYANGFLVGDGQIQGKYESLELAAQGRSTRLPARWRIDYAHSARR